MRWLYSTISEIETAIERLQPSEVTEFTAWLNEYQQIIQASSEIFVACKSPVSGLAVKLFMRDSLGETSLSRRRSGPRSSLVGGIEHHFRPMFIIRPDNHDPEAVLLALHSDALRVINVKVDAKGWWVLRRHPREPVFREFGTVSLLVDNAINADAVQRQPEPYLKWRADGSCINPNAEAAPPKLSEKHTGASPQRFAQPSVDEVRQQTLLPRRIAASAD